MLEKWRHQRGTMFPFRASKLYDLYSTYDSLDSIPGKEKEILRNFFFAQVFIRHGNRPKPFFQPLIPNRSPELKKTQNIRWPLFSVPISVFHKTWLIQGNPQENRLSDLVRLCHECF
jgi:hypothetical protein